MLVWSAAPIARRQCRSGLPDARRAAPAWTRPGRSSSPRPRRTTLRVRRSRPARTLCTSGGRSRWVLGRRPGRPRRHCRHSSDWSLARRRRAEQRPRAARPGPALGATPSSTPASTGLRSCPLTGNSLAVPLSTEAGPPVGTSAGVAFVHDGTAYLLTPPYDAPPRPLLAADGLFPMVWPDMVGAERGDGPGGPTAMYVDLEQARSRRRSPIGSSLPAISRSDNSLPWVPAAFSAAGRPARGGRVQLGQVVGHAAAVIGTVGSSVVWLSAGTCAPNGECTLHRHHLGLSPRPTWTRSFSPLRGHEGFLRRRRRRSERHAHRRVCGYEPGPRRAGHRRYRHSRLTLVPDSTIAVGHGAPTARGRPTAPTCSSRVREAPCTPMRPAPPGRSASTSRDPAASPWVKDRPRPATANWRRRIVSCGVHRHPLKYLASGNNLMRSTLSPESVQRVTR